jgi:hypothetical protein
MVNVAPATTATARRLGDPTQITITLDQRHPCVGALFPRNKAETAKSELTALRSPSGIGTETPQ